MEENIVNKKVRLTKNGLPDKRAETSKKNLEKGKSIIKQALQKIKEKPQEITQKKVEYSSDEFSTDDEEEVLIPPQRQVVGNGIPTEKFTFEKKLDEIQATYNNKINLLEEETKMTKQELKLLKEQNQALKKSITGSFRTHAGVLNQEMYLKF